MTKIQLRQVNLNDIDILLTIENDETAWKFSENNRIYSRDEITQFVKSDHSLEKYGQLRFMVQMKETNTVVGCMDLFDHNTECRRAGVGVYVLPDFRGQHIGSSSVQELMDIAQEKFNIRLFYCSIHEENITSIKLFENCGFKLTGKREKWTTSLTGKKWADVHLYQKERG